MGKKSTKATAQGNSTGNLAKREKQAADEMKKGLQLVKLGSMSDAGKMLVIWINHTETGKTHAQHVRAEVKALSSLRSLIKKTGERYTQDGHHDTRALFFATEKADESIKAIQAAGEKVKLTESEVKGLVIDGVLLLSGTLNETFDHVISKAGAELLKPKEKAPAPAPVKTTEANAA